MEFLKNLFKDDEKVVGLCAFNKKEAKRHTFAPKFSTEKLIYSTNYEKNLFLL